MKLTPEDKVDLSSHRLTRAREFLNAAGSLIKSRHYESSVNRSYYAILTAAKALLVLRGIDPETHEGVKTMLSREFIKTEILPRAYGEVFRSVQARRLDSDYGDYVEISKDEAEDALDKAEDFIETVSAVIQGMLGSES